MAICIVKQVIRLAACCGMLGLLTLVGGCGRSPRSVEHMEVSGKVLLGGTPLPGGQVSFVTVKGGFASSGTIDENGNYQIKAPVGEVAISVSNAMLQPRGRRGPANTPHPKQSGAPEDQPMKGRWVSMPSRYMNPDTSGLKYTVKPGAQTHDIELSTNIAPDPGASGS
jgi:hypothetical protein